MRNWRFKNPEKYKEYSKKQLIYQKKYYNNLRLKALDKLGGRKCSKCGCNILKILEINHIDGGGCKEHRISNSKRHYIDIVNNNKNLSKYNVLCRVCNSFHYVRDILKIKGHKVSWKDSTIKLHNQKS
ncbi:hypothetical protein LCGC14_2491080 [marine sediment metagenome]|uniref:Uncharacterized protein n=1 Tax=marine sediment metagenome TaxID=412755 RepID=A0A0F9B5E2_9ZZZZ